jgi:ribonuclease VapC
LIVVDTSAIVAALAGEPERARINETLAGSALNLMSAGTYLECSIVLAARHGDDGVHDLRLYLHEAGVEIVPVDRDLADAALRGWSRYGRGRHPAALNFGDCFAYALAATRAAPLLFTGDDFARTDIQAA